MFAENSSNVGQTRDRSQYRHFTIGALYRLETARRYSRRHSSGRDRRHTQRRDSAWLPADRKDRGSNGNAIRSSQTGLCTRSTVNKRSCTTPTTRFGCARRRRARTSSCRSARFLRVSPTRSWSNWTVGSGRTQRNASDLSERSKKVWSLKLHLTPCNLQRATNRALRCDSPAFTAFDGTNHRVRPIGWKRSNH